ncbi:spermidine/putrescine ABC transporter permease [Acidocella aquatica]|uniref:Spermidine/putrescine ABC transporter permease n=1 Tax=Acidocella aquatica TaxID=1922313 RepID=A0ABQ6A3X4_9PROT|nr:ABC transporter permease [Acidocella aquatica]GLR66536.1 spermidine/putrescine ABC transporter permease [Acidocella aquatica]
MKRTWRAALSAFGWRHEGAANAALLGLPAVWFLALYLAAIGALLVTAFWTVDDLSGNLIPGFSFSNFQQLLGDPIYRTIAVRTIFIAAAVTVTDAVLAWPFAYAMVRLAGPKLRAVLMALVLVPLWSSYLARVYAWRLILAHDGVLNWALNALGLPDMQIGYSNWAMWIVFSYLWLPFMILPLAAAVERIPPSLLEASADLGERGMATFRRVILPMALPGMVAGAIFTFSLTLGDFVTPMLVGGKGSDFIGNVVYANVGVTNNIPFAAAYAVLPLGVMAVFLLLARKLGAFDAL